MTKKEKVIKELKEALNSLDITNEYRLNLIRAIEYHQEEPVSEDLEDAAYNFVMDNFGNPKEPLYKFDQRCFKAGAKWQKEQFEKERLKHCDALTAEQAQIESDFVVNHLKKHNSTPTFIDAIEYGMRLQRENMMANTADATIGLPYENKDGGYTHLVDVSRPLPVGNNKITIIFKED